MTTLEQRYRRLLRFYPPAHRDVYEEEMLGVLLAAAPPGRRFPGPADAFDLVRGALTVRFGRGSKADHGTAWRDAAALSALLVALLIGGFAVATFTEAVADLARGVPLRLAGPAGLADPALRSVAWLAVAVVALTGRFRAAALLSGLTLLVELGTLAFWLGVTPWAASRLAWTPSMAIVVTVAFAVAAPARPIRVLTGRFGLGLIAVAAAVTPFATWAVETTALQPDDLSVWLPFALFTGVLVGTDRPVRWRAALLFLGMLLAPIVLMTGWDSTVLAGMTSRVPEVISLRGVVLSLAPLGIVAIAGFWFARRFAVRGRGHVKVHE
ncbi:hypothetical protein [Actinoplanes sp. HUAS TT8]|uniref:hypothetical protein n=1 Tax=Actinoplanes sp. HUAS TT8 TaxID=3447453 RepID=UPI003F524FC4